MIKFLAKLGRDDRGATAVEYGLILALMFLAILGAVQSFGETTINMWTDVSDEISAATNN